MAQMKRLKASSVVEVVIAMTVALIVITIAMAIIGKVNKGSLSVRKLRARLILENLALSNNIGNCEDRKIENDWTIKCSSETSDGTGFVHLTLIDENGSLLAEIEKIVDPRDER
jgi:hypothetical protein